MFKSGIVVQTRFMVSKII